VALVGDLLLIPLLERVRGLSYLRLSATVETDQRILTTLQCPAVVEYSSVFLVCDPCGQNRYQS
jgi:hypothetical protein